ncbi:MAG: SH3 domain-containing protein [Treponema sp.]|jgi:hypothetical protein|nr:SH3 domain-containing protein [Treponema sp.]
MKKLFVFFVFVLLVSGALFAQQITAGGTAWISSKTADLKSSTGFFAGRVGTLQMGDQVTVLQISGSKVQVRSAMNSSLSGWVASSSLSARRIVAAGSSATATEVAMAGKGFDQEVENAYKTDGNLNYADVDRAEAITVSLDELYTFVTEGRLNTGE